MLMIFKLSDNQPIDTMKADYCVVVWAVNLSEQTLFDLPLRHFDLNVRPLSDLLINPRPEGYGSRFVINPRHEGLR